MIKPFIVALGLGTVAFAGPVQADTILPEYEAQARAADPSFSGFSAERGQAFYLKDHATGKAETPSCTTCHMGNPTQAGRTRAGKTIAPMALSQTPDRFQDVKKVEKWFRRNCKSVLGRECSPQEKGDFITFMKTQ
ncbi:DUF1924 domain-containing protein [Terasakiella pusilla]|uniref:DUF1924 domain-containing protein n=1 Tax=Terasakiella pusilla TaxID=64973 RepID=UPI00048B68CA|nr:DUF1924 domain-containing protein [Terasakiella pusilla]